MKKLIALSALALIASVATAQEDYTTWGASRNVNLKTTGLAAGTYRLNFKAGADPLTHGAEFKVR